MIDQNIVLRTSTQISSIAHVNYSSQEYSQLIIRFQQEIAIFDSS